MKNNAQHRLLRTLRSAPWPSPPGQAVQAAAPRLTRPCARPSRGLAEAAFAPALAVQARVAPLAQHPRRGRGACRH